MFTIKLSCLVTKCFHANFVMFGTVIFGSNFCLLIVIVHVTVIDKTLQMERNLSELEAELNRIKYLLKIADPNGEAIQKRASNSTETQAPKSTQSVLSISRHCQSNEQPNPILDKLKSRPSLEETHILIPAEKASEKVDACENKPEKMPAYTIAKPQWLGAARKIESEDDQISKVKDADMSDNFVDYNDRKKFLVAVDNEDNLESEASGLILRKRKSTEKADRSAEKTSKVEVPSSPEAETIAADAVALLLKHKRGIHVIDELIDEKQKLPVDGKSGKEDSHVRRSLGPTRPDFLDANPDYDSWVPPKGEYLNFLSVFFILLLLLLLLFISCLRF